MASIVPNRPSSVPSDVVVSAVAQGSSSFPSSSADAIRNRLLFKLGIYDPAFTGASIRHKIQREIRLGPAMTDGDSMSTNNNMQPRPSLLPGAEQDEPQNRQTRSSPHREERQTATGDYMHLPHLLSFSDLSSYSSFSTLTDESGSDPPRGRIQDISTNRKTNKSHSVRVRIDPSVTIIPIPSHRSYDHRTRARMYVPKDEASFDIVRNTREFVYEGWDWRNAIEEDGMYLCTASREFVHPVHVDYRDKNNVIAKYHLKFAGLTTSDPNLQVKP
jgi:hypothetical protein